MHHSILLFLAIVLFGHAAAAEDGAVRVEGIVVDSFVDETNPDVVLHVLDCDGKQTTVTADANGRGKTGLPGLIGAQVSVSGICPSPADDNRNIRAHSGDITVVNATAADPFAAPFADAVRATTSPGFALAERRRIRGRVLASWPRDNFLVRTPQGEVARVNVAHGYVPVCGDSIEVSGFIETDHRHVNLSRCICRRTAARTNDVSAAERVTVRQLLFDEQGRFRVNSHYHGRHVVISGRATGLSSVSESHVQFIISCGSIYIPFYVPKTSPVTVRPDSVVEIDGICIVDSESGRGGGGIARVRELLIAVPDATHVRTLRNPPWWTTDRLLVAISGLLFAICGTVLWNLSLRRSVARKSRDLEKELSARLESNLKTRERTRLAVELHDSISQNLSGMAMEIGSAVRLAPTGIANMLPHLGIASKTLQSCRDDLRDCLWDLRSNALEEADMNDAIRTTLRPYLAADTSLGVRFNVPRKTLSDNMTHTLLRIVRELVSNALRHGHATEIKIAGTIDGRALLFSVQDNGCGFEPDECPGIEQGHFGLSGIRERIRKYDGQMKIASRRSCGAKVSVTMNIRFPQEEDQGQL